MDSRRASLRSAAMSAASSSWTSVAQSEGSGSCVEPEEPNVELLQALAQGPGERNPRLSAISASSSSTSVAGTSSDGGCGSQDQRDTSGASSSAASVVSAPTRGSSGRNGRQSSTASMPTIAALNDNSAGPGTAHKHRRRNRRKSKARGGGSSSETTGGHVATHSTADVRRLINELVPAMVEKQLALALEQRIQPMLDRRIVEVNERARDTQSAILTAIREGVQKRETFYQEIQDRLDMVEAEAHGRHEHATAWQDDVEMMVGKLEGVMEDFHKEIRMTVRQHAGAMKRGIEETRADLAADVHSIDERQNAMALQIEEQMTELGDAISDAETEIGVLVETLQKLRARGPGVASSLASVASMRSVIAMPVSPVPQEGRIDAAPDQDLIQDVDSGDEDGSDGNGDNSDAGSNDASIGELEHQNATQQPGSVAPEMISGTDLVTLSDSIECKLEDVLDRLEATIEPVSEQMQRFESRLRDLNLQVGSMRASVRPTGSPSTGALPTGRSSNSTGARPRSAVLAWSGTQEQRRSARDLSALLRSLDSQDSVLAADDEVGATTGAVSDDEHSDRRRITSNLEEDIKARRLRAFLASTGVSEAQELTGVDAAVYQTLDRFPSPVALAKVADGCYTAASRKIDIVRVGDSSVAVMLGSGRKLALETYLYEELLEPSMRASSPSAAAVAPPKKKPTHRRGRSIHSYQPSSWTAGGPADTAPGRSD